MLSKSWQVSQMLHFRNICSYSQPPGIASGIKAADLQQGSCYAADLDAGLGFQDASPRRLFKRIVARPNVCRLTS